MTSRNKTCIQGVQTLVFPKDEFTLAQARHWAKTHGFSVAYIDVKPGSFRIRQKGPRQFKRFASKKLPNGIVIVSGYC